METDAKAKRFPNITGARTKRQEGRPKEQIDVKECPSLAGEVNGGGSRVDRESAE